MINVLVVDDSAFMRKMLSEMLANHDNIHVVDKARNGKDAVEKVLKLKPDVVTMDVEMPIMSGIDALKEIMAIRPTPVIMVSSVTKAGAETTIKAMEYGAFDFISKPSGSISLDIHKVEQEIIEKVLYASKVSLMKLKKEPLPKVRKNQVNLHQESHSTSIQKSKEPSKEQVKNFSKVVLIGTSTRGPKALQSVLPHLPRDFPHPILIVQHMPKGFTKSLSERLNTLSEITVKEAENGEVLKKGVAYIAPGGYHLKVRTIGTSVAVHLDQNSLVNGHRPSVDVMFTSISSMPVQSVIAVVLTGMGSDGKKGLVRLKKAKRTIALAEAESSSVVYGMPKAAIDTNLVDEVVDLNDVATTIIKYC
ncbi:chemotaxis response regulator protein-glutamate methylesterase [Salipaludibacillus keqinensis]|uniref:Protein-glutamate methylesterase/protein-glutamine glutaminase n=1 Tax=Salipaludibacillus keqinensis TaxID=2045207 RepID=A0A323THW3_9BACI|nr:chemotaxis response regulator protein-glutamate methylesterase [Salipaludibacillus keqinensis]PYZ93127.1 chemotaxis response regulator protein-glutamate methylesterase [Salipaludibacillus keqinensis]